MVMSLIAREQGARSLDALTQDEDGYYKVTSTVDLKVSFEEER